MNPTRARVLGVGIINQPARRRVGGLGQGHVGGANTCAARFQDINTLLYSIIPHLSGGQIVGLGPRFAPLTSIM